MAYQGVILDLHLKFVREIRGNYANGVFKWNDGQFLSPNNKSTGVDFNSRIVVKNTKRIGNNSKIFLLIFNGKDYVQLAIKEFEDKYGDVSQLNHDQFINYLKIGKLELITPISQEKANLDAQRDFKLGQYVKRAQIHQPRDMMKSVLEFLLFSLFIISAIANYYEAVHIQNAQQPTLTAMNKTLQQTQLNQRYMMNLTNILINILKQQGYKLPVNTTNPTLPSAP